MYIGICKYSSDYFYFFVFLMILLSVFSTLSALAMNYNKEMNK